jgi:hypothetical protein
MRRFHEGWSVVFLSLAPIVMHDCKAPWAAVGRHVVPMRCSKMNVYLMRSLISIGHSRMNAMPRIDIKGSPRAMAK